MKRLPQNPREDADVLRTGTFPDMDAPVAPYVNPVCENCRFWKRDKWPAKYVKQWGEAGEGECLHAAKQPCFGTTDEDGVEHFSKHKTGAFVTCKHWEVK
jgi:hypothetical protein